MPDQSGRVQSGCCKGCHVSNDNCSTHCESGRGTSPQNFLGDLDEPLYDLVERPGEALTNRLTCIRCRGPRRNGDALCRRCRWSPRRVVQVWWHTR